MKRLSLLSALFIVTLLFGLNNMAIAQTTITIGTGTSSSSTRGPVQISGGTSTTQYSRFVQIYTAAELAATGMTAGSSISELLWELASTNTITSGTGTFKVYIKNSSATVATSDTWANLTAGSTLAVNNTYDVNNNFPGVSGWMPFTFMAPFTYTGGALEIAVDWDFSIPTGTGFTSTNGDGIKWRWEATATDLVVKKTSSSAPSSNITDLKSERANIQMVYTAGSTGGGPSQTITIGSGTSSSSTRGPFQRADTNSTTVFSRYVQIYTASELAAAGITAGAAISELQWELASSNTIIGSGNANLKVYVKNSSATAATSDTWANLISGSTLAVNNNYNTTNNFPGANGWMPFAFSAPFVYTGGALEVAVDWDCSQVSTPAFSGNGALKWRWESTAPDDLVVKKTSSSSPSTTITDLKDERANIQIVYSMPAASTLNAFDLLTPANNAFIYVAGPALTPVDISWESAGANAVAYEWRAVGTGGSLNTPAAILPSDNMGMDTTLSLTVQAVDDLLASLGVAVGDTAVLDWTIVAYDASGDSLFATMPHTASLLRLGVSTPLLLNAPQTNGSTTTLRAPNGSTSHNFLRAATIVLPNEFATAGIAANTTIRNFGFNTDGAIPAGAVTGVFKLYLQNTADASYLKGTAWSGIETGMTEVFNDTITINGGGTAWDVALDTMFAYAGNSVYVAYDWEIIANPLATAISYMANTAVTGSLVSASSTTAAPTTLGGSSFRPEFSWGIDKTADDLSVTNLYAMGKNPLTYGAGEQIEVTVTNNGYLPADKTVTLDITGANTFTATETVSILPGASSIVTFSPFTATTAGYNNISVSVPADQNTANDVQTWVQESTTDTYSYADSVLTGLGGVGYNTGSGLLLNRYYVNGTGAINQVNVHIANNAATVGNPVYAVLIDTSGTIVAQSAPYTVTASDLNSWVTFALPNPVTLTDVDFLIGLAQPANATGYYPVSYQDETPTRPNAYYTADLNGANIGTVNGFRLMIEAVVSQVCFITSATTTTDVACNGGNDGSIDLTVTGGSPTTTYAWSNGDITEDISGLAAGTYTVTITDSACVITATAMIMEPTLLTVATSSVADTAGTGVGSATAVVTGGTAPYTYEWDGNVGTDVLSGLTPGNYTVIITDANGCTATSTVTVDESVSTTNIDYVTNLSIYPNPTNGQVRIDLELSRNADVAVSIYTVTGVLVEDFGKSNTAKQTHQVDLSNYAAGMYLVRFVVDNKVVTKKLILNK